MKIRKVAISRKILSMLKRTAPTSFLQSIFKPSRTKENIFLQKTASTVTIARRVTVKKAFSLNDKTRPQKDQLKWMLGKKTYEENILSAFSCR